MRIFTVEGLKTSAYVKERWNQPWGFVIETQDGIFGQETRIAMLRLRDVFERIADCKPIEDPRNVPDTINKWMQEKNIATIYQFEKAANRLSAEQKTNLIQGIFNGGGHPDAKGHWHPALLQVFISWVIRLLVEFNSIDGRINKHGEAMINAARKCKDMGKVRRF